MTTYDPTTRTPAQLLRDWSSIMRELRRTGVVRTNNNPVGDIAEAIVAQHYGGERGSFAQAGWDVKTPDGTRIQVKAIRQTSTNKRSNVSPIRDSDYDQVVLVVFDEDFLVTEGWVIDRETVEELFPVKEYVNGRVITLTGVLRANERVSKVDLRPAAEHLHGV